MLHMFYVYKISPNAGLPEPTEGRCSAKSGPHLGAVSTSPSKYLILRSLKCCVGHARWPRIAVSVCGARLRPASAACGKWKGADKNAPTCSSGGPADACWAAWQLGAARAPPQVVAPADAWQAAQHSYLYGARLPVASAARAQGAAFPCV